MDEANETCHCVREVRAIKAEARAPMKLSGIQEFPMTPPNATGAHHWHGFLLVMYPSSARLSSDLARARGLSAWLSSARAIFEPAQV